MKLKACCLWFVLSFVFQSMAQEHKDKYTVAVIKVLRKQIMQQAKWAMTQTPITVTAETSARTAGTRHDYFSEGDYWWPDPSNPTGPYIQKDGLTNPDNFVAHRLAMIRLSKIIGSLASAYKITGRDQYVQQAFKHLNAWFVNTETLMNPNLLFAQAIQGRFTGRGIGIIDTIQLMEVAQGVLIMQNSPAADGQILLGVKNWFASYLIWLTTHSYGIDEMNAANNHGTCWTLQVASFAKLTGNRELLNFCRERYKSVLLPNQMASDGSFPKELKRTKPYGYSLFNLEVMTMLCQILSDKENDLWSYQLADGRSIKKGIECLYPFVENKSLWPFSKDVMYWDYWPVAQSFLLFGAKEFANEAWWITWKKLDHQPNTEEVVRNFPIRNPIIWFE